MISHIPMCRNHTLLRNNNSPCNCFSLPKALPLTTVLCRCFCWFSFKRSEILNFVMFNDYKLLNVLVRKCPGKLENSLNKKSCEALASNALYICLSLNQMESSSSPIPSFFWSFIFIIINLHTLKFGPYGIQIYRLDKHKEL